MTLSLYLHMSAFVIVSTYVCHCQYIWLLLEVVHMILLASFLYAGAFRCFLNSHILQVCAFQKHDVVYDM